MRDLLRMSNIEREIDRERETDRERERVIGEKEKGVRDRE